MKKYLILAMVCLGFSFAKAEKTDVSVIDNVVYLEEETAKAGTQHTLSVKMKNTDMITGYEFYLELPEGLSFTKDEDGFYLTALSTARTTAKKTNYFDCTVDEKGLLHVLCSTTAASPSTGNLYTFSGNDGEVCTVAIDVPEDFTPGTYPLYLKDVVLTPSGADKGYETAVVECLLAVEGKDPTGINSVDSEQKVMDNIYNLAGQRMAAPQKGINIVGSKKVVVK